MGSTPPRSRRLRGGLLVAALAGLAAGWLAWGTGERVRDERSDPRAVTETSTPLVGARREAPAPVPSTTRAAVVAAQPESEPFLEAVVELRVQTRATYSPEAPPVPHVPFEIGLGPGFGPGERPLLSGTTDQEGRATIALPRRVLAGARDSLWARVARPGCLRSTRSFELPDPGLKEILLVVQPGLSLVGRVLDEAGAAPRAELQVALLFSDPELGSRPDTFEYTTQGGWFELALRREGPAHLLADSPWQGIGVGELRVDFEHPPPQPFELVLRGSGVLRGRVVEPGGRPAAGVRLQARRVSLDLPDPAQVSRLLEAERMAGEGHPMQGGLTDLDGRFELLGLRPGLYVIDSSGGPRSGAARLTPVPVLADGAELLLAFERPHLVVRVRDEQGRLWNPVPGLTGSVDTSDWPRWPRVRVLPLGAPIGPSGMPRDLFGTSLGDALAFEVAEGQSLLVGLYGGLEPWRPTRVDVTASGRTEIELQVTSASALGTLEVSASAEDERHDGLAIRIEDPESGFPLLARNEFDARAWPLTFTVPEGTWRLVVEGRRRTFKQHDWRVVASASGRFETLVRIRADERSAVRADLPAYPTLDRSAGQTGARLRIAASGRPCAADALADDLSGLGPRGVTLTLTAPTRWPLEVGLEGPPLEASFGARRRLMLGSEDLSEILPTGLWTLEGRLADGRTARAEVELTDGVTTAARLEFE